MSDELQVSPAETIFIKCGGAATNLPSFGRGCLRRRWVMAVVRKILFVEGGERATRAIIINARRRRPIKSCHPLPVTCHLVVTRKRLHKCST